MQKYVAHLGVVCGVKIVAPPSGHFEFFMLNVGKSTLSVKLPGCVLDSVAVYVCETVAPPGGH